MKWTITCHLFVITLVACHSSPKTSTSPDEIQRVIVSTGSCLGYCPSLTIEVDKQLRYKFFGAQHATLHGFYTGTVQPYFWDTLTSMLERSFYQKQDTVYSYRYLDTPPFEIMIENNTSKKTISGDWESAPNELRTFLFWLTGSYSYVKLKKTDTLLFESRLHKSIVDPASAIRQLADSLKTKEPGTK